MLHSEIKYLHAFACSDLSGASKVLHQHIPFGRNYPLFQTFTGVSKNLFNKLLQDILDLGLKYALSWSAILLNAAVWTNKVFLGSTTTTPLEP